MDFVVPGVDYICLVSVTRLPLAKQRKAMLGQSLETSLVMVGSVLKRHTVAKHVLGIGGKHLANTISGTFILILCLARNNK